MFKRTITTVILGAAISTVCGAWAAQSSAVPIVIPGEDGSAGVSAQFVTAPGLPLMATSNQAWNRNGPGMAGAVIALFKPGFTAANLAFNQASLNSLLPISQGTFSVQVKAKVTGVGAGVVQALAYSWQDKKKTHYGISYVPSTTGSTLEDGRFNLVVNTNLSQLQTSGALSNGLVYSSTKKAPKSEAENFQLLAIGVAVADGNGSSAIQAYFQQFKVNSTLLNQDLTTNLNFTPLSSISDLGSSIRSAVEKCSEYWRTLACR
jgi:hypothetical protein